MEYLLDKVEIVVIVAGHAVIEAALASAKLGCRTILLTMSLDQIANMPCNPSIGGTAKGHLVREIDALGGEMGKAADENMIQSRILNRGKGPAVHSPRAQIDRNQYHVYMKNILETQKNLYIKQDEAVEIRLNKNTIAGVATRLGAFIQTDAVIICCGTYLNSKIFVGQSSYFGGPDGSPGSGQFSESLKNLNLKLRRFKTGTPARVNRRSIDFGKLEVQNGDDRITPFSFLNQKQLKNKIQCFIAYTNRKTHNIIKQNLKKYPL